MKCPQCQSNLNLKVLVPIARFGRIEAALCAFCGGFAAVDLPAGTARALPACSSCGAPRDTAPDAAGECAPCRELEVSGAGWSEPDEEAASRFLKDVMVDFPQVGDPESAAYFQTVLESLMACAGCEKRAFRCIAVSDLGSRIVGLPGGAILAGREFLEDLEDEAMLAFALARELAHQQSGRVYRRYRARRNLGPLGASLDWGITILTAGALSLDASAAEIVREVAALGYGPEHEHQADEWAVKLLEGSGYDETAAVRYLGLTEKRHLEARGVLATFLEVHPARSRRRCLVETLVTIDRKRKPTPTVNREGYRRIVDGLREAEFAPQGSRPASRPEPQA